MSEIDVNEMNRGVIAQMRANEGKVLEGRFAGSDLLLLTTKGAKSGQPHTNPLMYLRDGDRYVIFASRNGGPKHPDWYFNLVANPDVEIEVKGERFVAKASVPQGDEAERVWSQCIEQRPFLADMRAKARPRKLPLIVLERKETPA
jgi:deazaflavin-dependent oxidoreductase (nitroreductase family)